MLIIRRREGEAVLIGDAISIQVLEISPSRVKLGIDAPRPLEVLRSEQRASAEENRRASDSAMLNAHSLREILHRDPSA